jgi:hypothetical protein
MTSPFLAREMTRQDARRAYALVEAVRPEIPFDEWINHIECVLDGDTAKGARTGAMVLTAGSEHLYGAFTYGEWTTLALGRTLMIDDFCAVGLEGEQTPARVLLESADALAARQGCKSVCVKFLDSDRDPASWNPHAVGAQYFPLQAMAKRVD